MKLKDNNIKKSPSEMISSHCIHKSKKQIVTWTDEPVFLGILMYTKTTIQTVLPNAMLSTSLQSYSRVTQYKS